MPSARTSRPRPCAASAWTTTAWAPSPWMLAHHVDGTTFMRNGNDDTSGRALVHGAFRCAGDDRWVAVAAWDEDDVDRLEKVTAGNLAEWCAARSALEAAEALQGV